MNLKSPEQKRIFVFQDSPVTAQRIERDITLASDQLGLPPFAIQKEFTNSGFENGFALLRQKPPSLIVTGMHYKWTEPDPLTGQVPPEDTKFGQKIIDLIRETPETVNTPIVVCSVLNRADLEYQYLDRKGVPSFVSAIDLNDSSQCEEQWRRTLIGLK